MRAILNRSEYSSRSRTAGVWVAMLCVLTLCLCATAASAAPPPIVLSQVNWLNTLEGGGALASGNAAGTTMGVNSVTGDVIISTTYGNKVLQINPKTGAATTLVDWGSDIGENYNIGPIALDSKNNLYVGGLYTNNIIKIPFVSGAYVAAPYPTAAPANCTGTDTAECNFGSNLTNGNNGYYFGVVSMAFDAAGDFFFAMTNSNTAPNSIWECTVACLSTGTPAATLLYQEPTSVTAAQLMVGAIAVDPWGNVFFTDSDYNGGKNESLYSDLNELMVSTGAGYGGATTGYAAAPTVLYTETIATPGSYDDELDGVAIAANGTVYFADQYNGVYAFPNTGAAIPLTGGQPTNVYAISPQGGKTLAIDASGNAYVASYVTAISSGGADTVGQILVDDVTVPGATATGSTTTLTNVDVVFNDGGCSVASTTITSSSSEFVATVPATATTCSSMMFSDMYLPLTVAFTPTAAGGQSTTLKVTDSLSNTESVSAAGSGPNDFVTQVNWLNTLTGGGALASGDAAGSSFGVNSASGDIIIGTSYGNKVLQINATTGAATTLVDWGSDIGENYNVGPVALDSKNNLYVGGLYTNNIIKIPFVNGAYVAAPYPNLSATPPTPANCTGNDTAECNFGSNLTNANNGYYFGVVSMLFDSAGDLFFAMTNSNTAPNSIWECTAACLSTGTPAAIQLYQEPTSVTAAQLMVGGLAIDPWGNLFFTDSDYNGGKNESLYSDLNELPVSTGLGYGGVATGYAAAPTVLYTNTIATPGSYDDELDGVAVDPVAGTVYLADQYNGIFAFPNSAGTVDTAAMYTVVTQGSKVLALDAKDNVYGASYQSVIASGQDTVFQATVNAVTTPSSLIGVAVSPSATLNPVTAILNDGNCSTTPVVTIGSSSAEFTAVVSALTGTETTNCSTTMSGGSSFPITVTFTPTAGGEQTATLTSSDTNGGNGIASITGLGVALTPQTIAFTEPTASATYPTTYGVAPITLAATGGGSGNPVVFTVDSTSTAGAGSVSGTNGATLTITGVGTIVIDANQAGNSSYAAAPQVQLTITVAKASQTITFAPTTPITFSTTPITLSATGGASGNAVTFTVTSGPGTITGTAAAPTLTLSNFGTVVVAANQLGNADYLAAATVSVSIVVNPITTITTPAFTPATGATLYLGEPAITIGALTPATAAIYYTIGTTGTTPTASSTLYTSAGIPVPTTVGTYTVEAIGIQAGYTSSAVATATYTVSALPPAIVLTPSTGTSGLTLTPGQATGNTVTITVSSQGGFSGTVTLTCTVDNQQGANSPPLCSIPNTPLSVTGTTPQTATLTITTFAQGVTQNRPMNLFWPSTGGTALALVLFFAVPKRRRNWLAMLGLLVIAISFAGLGCGGSFNMNNNQSVGTTPGTYVVNVNAVSGALSQTAAVDVTVQ